MQRARARTFCLAARSSNRSIAEEAACAEPALSSAAAPAAKPESTWGRRAGVGVEGRAALAGGLRRARARAAAGLAAVLQRWRRRPGRARARSPRGATPQRRGPPRRTCDGRGGPDARSMGGIWSRARARCGRGCGRSSACCRRNPAAYRRLATAAREVMVHLRDVGMRTASGRAGVGVGRLPARLAPARALAPAHLRAISAMLWRWVTGGWRLRLAK